jgi:glycosyltransferase involved in cell wall biosynthesis
VIVVVDAAPGTVDITHIAGVSILQTSGGEGPGRARHLGVRAATGDIIALLDDDDEWEPDKLAKQLAAAPTGEEWIVSCRFGMPIDESRTIPYPRHLIDPQESVAGYLFNFRSPRRARSALPTSTLIFPRAVERRVPLSVSAGSVHDDPLWLIEVRRALPQLTIVQIPEVLMIYGATVDSLSRSAVDRSAEYIAWGLRELADESDRVRGDYFLTNPVSAALVAAAPRGVTRSIRVGATAGRPGVWAWCYAISAFARASWRRLNMPTNGVRR